MMPQAEFRRGTEQLRIAALQPSISLVLAELDALDCLVACTKYCVEAVPALRNKPIAVIADSWSSTAEELLATRPNLVLASVPYRLESLAAILKAGCPVLTLAPHSLGDVFADIRLLGSILGRPECGEGVIRRMQQEMKAVEESVERATMNSTFRPRVYVEEWGKPLIHSQSWVAELVQIAGGEFVGVPGAVTGADAVAALDPDFLFFAWCGARDRVPLQRVIDLRGWHALQAVAQKNVFCIPDELLNTPAPTLMGGLHAIASALHPGIFGENSNLRRLP